MMKREMRGFPIKRRLIEAFAMLMIGDCVMAIVAPRKHLSLWAKGPQWWERMYRPFIHRTGLMRALGAVGLSAGIWLASRQERLNELEGGVPRKLLKS